MRTGCACVLTGTKHLTLQDLTKYTSQTWNVKPAGPKTLKGAKLSDSAGPTKLHHQDGQVVLAPAFTVRAV